MPSKAGTCCIQHLLSLSDQTNGNSTMPCLQHKRHMMCCFADAHPATVRVCASQWPVTSLACQPTQQPAAEEHTYMHWPSVSLCSSSSSRGHSYLWGIRLPRSPKPRLHVHPSTSYSVSNLPSPKLPARKCPSNASLSYRSPLPLPSSTSTSSASPDIR